MARRKVKLAFIENNSERKASCTKRKRGWMKKVQELSTLCGIDTCAILYSPFDNMPEVWPSDCDAMNHVLTRFKVLSDVERFKWMVNQESFTKHMKKKLEKMKKDNQIMEITNSVNKCLSGGKSVENFGRLDLDDMEWLIERNMKEITRRMVHLKKYSPEGAPLDMNTMPAEMGIDVNGGGINGGNGDGSYLMVVAISPEIPIIDSHNQMANLTFGIGIPNSNKQKA